MVADAREVLCFGLELPPVGASLEVQRGRMQLVLERSRRGLLLLAHDGHEMQRCLLGVPRVGRLALSARLPHHPLHIVPDVDLALAPGGRLRGFVDVELPFVLVWQREDHADEALVELVPGSLRETDSLATQPVHRVASTFALELGTRVEDGVAHVPVVLRNERNRAVRPSWLPVQLGRGDLGVAGRHIMARPRRVLFRDDDTVEEHVRECSER